jgi:hypothetical protein
MVSNVKEFFIIKFDYDILNYVVRIMGSKFEEVKNRSWRE